MPTPIPTGAAAPPSLVVEPPTVEVPVVRPAQMHCESPPWGQRSPAGNGSTDDFADKSADARTDRTRTATVTRAAAHGAVPRTYIPPRPPHGETIFSGFPPSRASASSSLRRDNTRLDFAGTAGALDAAAEGGSPDRRQDSRANGIADEPEADNRHVVIAHGPVAGRSLDAGVVLVERG